MSDKAQSWCHFAILIVDHDMKWLPPRIGLNHIRIILKCRYVGPLMKRSRGRELFSIRQSRMGNDSKEKTPEFFFTAMIITTLITIERARTIAIAIVRNDLA